MQSELFPKTLKESPKDEVSVNAQLLERAGFVYKNSTGIYTYLPLGWRVLQKIANIIREEMNKIGGQEMFMPAMIEKKYLEATGRWGVEIGFEVKGKKEKDAGFILGWSHEDLLTAIVLKYINSYKDLPFSVYQIQTKFRNEPRAKSGLLRNREFMMKDLYSFHANEEDLYKFYNIVKQSYFKIFERCGLKAFYTLAAGGVFTASRTNEFQVLSSVGEDTILVCKKCGYAENNEISRLKNNAKCQKCGGKISEEKSIEVGNIFPLGTKYSESLNFNFTDKNGRKKLVVMGSYGIGLGRLMGAVAEIYHDKKGIIWPESVAPFKVHLIELKGASAKDIYDDLEKKGVEVLYDDRDLSAGEKFADADLIGIPYRVVVSEKTAKDKKFELKKRNEEKIKLLKKEELIKYVGRIL